MQIFGLTDIGKIRETNEDSFGIVGFCDANPTSGIAVVADGMGGHKAGEIASAETVKSISKELEPFLGKNLIDQNIRVILASSVKNANTKVREMAQLEPGRAGMGTTVITAFVTGNTVHIAYVGDSRAYVINSTEIKQLSTDHSLVEDLVKDGAITREEAKSHPRKHVITRAVGTEENILIDILEYKYSSGDTLLLCTDGLTEMLDDSEIFEIINSNDNLNAALETLINKANELGGVDNITVVAARFDEDGPNGHLRNLQNAGSANPNDGPQENYIKVGVRF